MILTRYRDERSILDISQINHIAIIGAGTMGVGIAQNFAQAGLDVRLVDVNQEILDNSMLQIRANMELFGEYGLIREDISTIIARIRPSPLKSLGQAIKDCQYIVEAIPEILEAKKKMLDSLEEYSSGAIISSNTGSFTITELADVMKNPGRVIGVHYFNPAHIIPAVEIHCGEKTSQETVEITRGLMLKTGKQPALVKKVLPGFIVNRLTGALQREIGFLLDEGIVAPEDLDTVVKASIGFRMACLGPQETEDMIGLDTSVRVSERVFGLLSNATGPSLNLLAKVKDGMLGIKSGKGWYDYSGKSATEVLEAHNRKLLRQLALFLKTEQSK
jgi:3-hydroxybutyryl-CoA dehydrogenase